MRQRSSSIRFVDFFTEAENRGFQIAEIAEALLRLLQFEPSVGLVTGTRRIWTEYVPSPAEERGRREARHRCQELAWQLDTAAADRRPAIRAELARLAPTLAEPPAWIEAPRDPQPRPVPVRAWSAFDTVDAGCELRWADDDEKPYELAEADLISGVLETIMCDSSFARVRTRYDNLHLHAQTAERILADPQCAVPQEGTSLQPKHSDAERREWIRQRGRSGGGWTAAFDAYKAHPRYDGTKQAAFRDDCRAIWGAQNGRPKSVKEPVQPI